MDFTKKSLIIFVTLFLMDVILLFSYENNKRSIPYASVEFLLEVNSSSYLIEGSSEFKASNLIDGTYQSWAESSEGSGIGEYIEYVYDRKVRFDTFFISNGFGDLEYFHKNNRVKTIEISNEFGESRTVVLNDTFTFVKYDVAQLVGQTFRFIIKDVYSGSRWDDTCLAELIPGRTASKDFQYSVDFYTLLVDEDSRKGQSLEILWEQYYDSHDGSPQDKFDDFITLYPDFSQRHVDYDDGGGLCDKILEPVYDKYGCTYAVRSPESETEWDPILNEIDVSRTFFLTEKNEMLIIRTGSELSFKLNNLNVKSEDYIDICSLEEIFEEEIPNNYIVDYSYSNAVISIIYKIPDPGPYHMEGSFYEIHTSYKWDGTKFVEL